MKIRSVTFTGSSPVLKNCPRTTLPEYAFAGRSNVGKSSLINMLCGHKKLAKTSATPGKTQLINHFLINTDWYLADLPGYGYAKVSKTNREIFSRMIQSYLLRRDNLVCTFLLLDIRIPPQASDMQFMNWMGKNELPFVILFTKADKLSKSVLAQQLNTYKKAILEHWETLPPFFVTSSQTRMGKEEVLQFIEDTNTGLSKN